MDVLNMVGRYRGTCEAGERLGGINQKYTAQPSLTENPSVKYADIQNKIKNKRCSCSNTFQHDLTGDIQIDFQGVNGSKEKYR